MLTYRQHHHHHSCSTVLILKTLHSMAIYMVADPLTRLTTEMIAHTLGADQIEQLRTEFQVCECCVVSTYPRKMLYYAHS